MTGAQIATAIERMHAEINAQFASLNDPGQCARGGEDCRTCPVALLTPCRVNFDRTCTNLLNLMLLHFQQEESAMRQLGSGTQGLREFFEPHKEAHANLMEQLTSTFGDNGLPAEGRRSIRNLIRHWLDTHFIEHDQRLIAALDSRAP